VRHRNSLIVIVCLCDSHRTTSTNHTLNLVFTCQIADYFRNRPPNADWPIFVENGPIQVRRCDLSSHLSQASPARHRLPVVTGEGRRQCRLRVVNLVRFNPCFPLTVRRVLFRSTHCRAGRQIIQLLNFASRARFEFLRHSLLFAAGRRSFPTRVGVSR
jgi:hypothetical protein